MQETVSVPVTISVSLVAKFVFSRYYRLVWSGVVYIIIRCIVCIAVNNWSFISLLSGHCNFILLVHETNTQLGSI